jgi:hypothetical protein
MPALARIERSRHRRAPLYCAAERCNALSEPLASLTVSIEHHREVGAFCGDSQRLGLHICPQSPVVIVRLFRLAVFFCLKTARSRKLGVSR